MSTDGILRIENPAWWRERILNDLYFLCRTCLQTLDSVAYGYQDLYYPTHKRICDFVQNFAGPGQKLIILTPRGWVKSYIITVGWTIQRLLRNLTCGNRESQLITNATITNAENFLKRIKHNIKFNSLLRGLFADVLPEMPEAQADLWKQEEIELNGCLISTGAVEKNLVSQHYQIIINDDLVNRENSETKGQLEKTYDWWALAQSLLHPQGTEINIGTRWNYDDVYGRLIEEFIHPPKNYWVGQSITELHEGNYHLLQMDCWEDAVARTGSTFPTLFPETKLKELERQLGERFYGQYENNPLNKGINPFRSSWFVHWVQNSLPSIRYTCMLVDPSGKAKSTESSYTGITVLHFGVDGKVYIEYGKRWLITDMKLADKLIDLALEFRPDTIGIEDVKFSTMIDLLELMIANRIRLQMVDQEQAEYLKTLIGMMLELKPKGRPKEVRIRALTGMFETGKFLLPYNGAEDLEEEMVRYPSTKDDVVDSLAYALDVMLFPKKDDPPKYILPDKLKQTSEERIEEEWDKFREDTYYDGRSPEAFTDYDLF